MNPFLIIALVLAWVISLIMFAGSIIETEHTSEFRTVSAIAVVIGFFLLIICAAEWNQLHNIH